MLQNLVLKQHPGPLPCCGPPFCVEAPSGGVHFPIFFPGAENALGGLSRPGVIKATTSLHNLWLYLERQPLRLRVGVWLGLRRLPELKVSTCFLSRLGQKHLQVLLLATQSTKRASSPQPRVGRCLPNRGGAAGSSLPPETPCFLRVF